MADPINVPTVLISMLTSGAASSLISLFVKRRNDRADAQEDRRVAAFDAVLAAMASLNFAGKELLRRHERGGKRDFGETTEAVKKLREVIEARRLATGPVFAAELSRVATYWEDVMHTIWEEDMGAQYDPDTVRPEKHVFDAIPDELKPRLAPGTLADLKRAAEVELKRQIPLASDGGPPAAILAADNPQKETP